jgi:glycosyltransferase involved in cell wall biosynthesis
MRTKFSLVIPCYNEQGNIERLVERCHELFNEKIFEIIFVENGSTDNSFQILKKSIRDIKNFKVIRVKKNKGIGYGIIEGLKGSKGEIIGWTHGDLQTDPNDAKMAFIQSENIFGDFLIKGERISTHREKTDSLFSLGLCAFESILHQRFFWEINAQPNIFRKDFFLTWKNPPNDYQIDLFCYNKALKNKLIIKRFKVDFKKRYSGSSKWKIGKLDRFKMIFRTIIYSFKLRFVDNVDH